ncbi:NADH dehydrogenase [ubiquinone] iron-sulfur protein 6, mitochondrial-like [Bactrocera neohumeralis]|uniref:NADH dehydrogenase [ubiquinone] iron-sulfur protein 6, mitochondrial-like n=1 Tax=Bactrocera tryoni TaxID=59916 RepID=UPI001A962086|nr:NADH dehydrogenase [ubiquinone] iron-sulfur protein 6, mitochondrial-like [Bactrocera tryoni]XP_050318615.1 NADH dehydrogenase [ubiquinone] iron-sulfur protein 6, mitochondrial-like [Bactrocera neohumeralis]
MFSINFFKNALKCKRFVNFRLIRMRSDLKEITHTGQIWAEDDYRNVRFMNAKRWVNKNWGVKLAHQIETKITPKRVVYCDGDGPLGHPRVYICLDKPTKHWCHYCLKSFVKTEHAAAVLGKTPKK